MNSSALIQHRLVNQQLASSKMKTPQELVSWMGAMQAQDFGMAKWAIGLRLAGLKDTDVEKAFNDGKILRTHVLRPTWHFVAPADIRWMLALTAPRVHQLMQSYNKKLGLDAKLFKRATGILVKNLRDENFLSRNQLKEILERSKISGNVQFFAHLVMYAELEGVICSGPRIGKQFTYALLDERVPATKKLSREESLAELGKRYFASHGPATPHDFSWWSGLTIQDARDATAIPGNKLAREKIAGKEYFFIPGKTKLPEKGQSTFLLPDFDEYGVSYKDRSAILNPTAKPAATGNSQWDSVYYHTLILDGIAGGNWKRLQKAKETEVEIKLSRKLNKTQQQAVNAAVKKYLAFIGD